MSHLVGLFTRPKQLDWNQDHNKRERSGKVVKLIPSMGFRDKGFLKKCLRFSWIVDYEVRRTISPSQVIGETQNGVNTNTITQSVNTCCIHLDASLQPPAVLSLCVGASGSLSIWACSSRKGAAEYFPFLSFLPSLLLTFLSLATYRSLYPLVSAEFWAAIGLQWETGEDPQRAGGSELHFVELQTREL